MRQRRYPGAEELLGLLLLPMKKFRQPRAANKLGMQLSMKAVEAAEEAAANAVEDGGGPLGDLLRRR